MYIYCMEWISDQRPVQVYDLTDNLYQEKYIIHCSNSLNYIFTIKHLKIIIGVYAYGLSRFLGGKLGHGIQYQI